MTTTSAPLALFVGVSGYELTADEIAFLSDANPYGLFLFRRNLDHREQALRLCAQFREVVGRPDAPVFIDQEGGRVQRLDNGNWPIDNNLCENTIRPFVVGRKGWLFADTVGGATASANLYSIIETCKANGVDPYACLIELLRALPLATTADDYEALLPWKLSLPATRLQLR